MIVADFRIYIYFVEKNNSPTKLLKNFFHTTLQSPENVGVLNYSTCEYAGFN